MPPDNFDEVFDQCERTALNQLVLLAHAAQTLRGYLTDALDLDEALQVSHTLLATSHELRRWVGVVLPARAPDDDGCEACQADEAGGE